MDEARRLCIEQMTGPGLISSTGVARVADTVRLGSTVDQRAGDADILALSDVESGNMLVK